jgi:hypothetical protein|tara:strand:- start:223 stop:792 length:570 start_codon:yes stop_codon:yes gene_type:complete
MLEIEDIQKNWEMFESLIGMIEDENVSVMIGALENRLVTCPASQKKDQYGAYPGGLVEHSILVTNYLSKLNKLYSLSIPKKQILKVGLFHDFGKLGNLEGDLFIEQDSQWHIEKLGQMYKFNENIQKMSTSHRTLYLLQYFNVRLSEDEWIAVQIAQGNHFEENRFYVGAEPSLAMLLQQSKAAVLHMK